MLKRSALLVLAFVFAGAAGNSGNGNNNGGLTGGNTNAAPTPSRTLRPDDLEPINTFIGQDLKLDGANDSTAQGQTMAPSAAGRRGGTGIVPNDSGGGNAFGSGKNTSVTGAPAGAPLSNSGTQESVNTTPTSGTGTTAKSPTNKDPNKVEPSPGPSSTPQPTATNTFQNYLDPSQMGGAPSGGGDSSVSGTVSQGGGVFSARGIFGGPNGITLNPEIQAKIKAANEAAAKPAVEEDKGDLYKPGQTAKLPDQFAAGSNFAASAGAGPTTPLEGSSIRVGNEIYEFQGGKYVWIAGDKHPNSKKFTSAARNPAAIAKLAPGMELHANLGPVPFDKYEAKNGMTLGACATSVKVRDCINSILADRVKQKITSVRFMFGLAGGGDSTAILPDKTVNPAWIKNVELFMRDLKTAGIREIAPTPVFGGWSGDRMTEAEVSDECSSGKKVKLRFFAATPWGSRLEDNAPHGGGVVDAYHCSPANPNFVGWRAIHGAIETVLRSAKEAKLKVYELDLHNEINVDWFTVQARMIYDGKHKASGNPDLLAVTRALMTKYGFEASHVAYSVFDTAPTEPGYDCASSYGDSARVASLSALLDAIAGKPFGHAKDWTVEKGLGCGGSVANRIKLPVKHPDPGIIDVHAYTQGEAKAIRVETTLWANAVENAIKRRGLASTTFVLGETHSNTVGPNGKSCEGARADAGIEVAKALSDSKLASRKAILRPWFNQASSCYPINQKLSPPFVTSR